MEIQDFLSRTDTIVNVRASDKSGLLQELSRQAAARLNLRADLISGDILKREDLGSTGMGNGVAIPHARIPNLKKPFGILARLRRPACERWASGTGPPHSARPGRTDMLSA